MGKWSIVVNCGITYYIPQMKVGTLIYTQWAKLPKNQSVGVYFWQYSTVFRVPN